MNKKLGVLGVLFTTLMLLLPLAPAKADVGAGFVNGGGTISPGLSLVPTFQSGSFTGTVVGTHGGAVLNVSCNFTFQSTIPATQLTDKGTAQGSCAGGGTVVVCASASLHYERVAAEVEINGKCHINGVLHTVQGHLVFVPRSPPGQPFNAYALSGAITIDVLLRAGESSDT